jgi:two-component system, LytTR family, response regulator
MYATKKIDTIVFKTHTGLVVYEPEQIIHCEAKGSYTYVSTKSGVSNLLSKSLKQMVEILPSADFLRVHDSHIVNIKSILKFDTDNSKLMMKNSKIIPISRRKLADVKKALHFF